MDIAAVLLAANNKGLWLYYAGMATMGSVLGGYLTYRLARKGGKEALTKRLPRGKSQKVVNTFERWGFAAIAVPALLPPPLPMVPFLIAAGALQYSRGKFLLALSVGRLARYILVCFLAATYGRQLISVFSRHATATIAAGITLAAASVVAVLLIRWKGNPKRALPTHGD
jgi:membrane protein YqaA with SNARE-associated domain